MLLLVPTVAMLKIQPTTILYICSIACVLLIIAFFYALLRYLKTKARMEDIEAQHAIDIRAIQKVIYQQSIEDLANEIHDDFGQRLSLIKLMLSGLDPETRPDIGPQIIEIMQIATETIKDLRTFAHQLKSNNYSRNVNT